MPQRLFDHHLKMDKQISAGSHGLEGQDGREGQEGREKNDAPRNDVDETLEETFPASDAPANTPETGILIDPAADADRPDTTDTSDS